MQKNHATFERNSWQVVLPHNLNTHNMNRSFPFSALAPCLLLFACGPSVNKKDFSQYRYLRADTVNEFRTGDKFALLISENSCCWNAWLHNGEFRDDLQHKGFIKLVDSYDEEADPDCAGCSSFSTMLFECIKPGTDTLFYVYAPMGGPGRPNSMKDTDQEIPDSASVDVVPFSEYIKDYINQYIIVIK